MERLDPGDFFARPYANMYAAACDLSMGGNPVTVATVARRLSESGKLDETGGMTAIQATLEEALADELTYWVDVVLDCKQRRLLLSVTERAADLAVNAKSPDEAFRKTEEMLALAVKRKGETEVTPIGATGDEVRARLQRFLDDPDAVTGMEIGWPTFDQKVDGLQPGNVTCVYAPTSRFKSFFVNNIGWRFAQAGIPGLWFTTEMPKFQVHERITQLELGLNVSHLRRDRQLFRNSNAITGASRAVDQLPIILCDRTALDIGFIRAETTRRAKWDGVRYIIVDLVNHVTSAKYQDEQTRNQELVMQTLKDTAKTANVHVLFCAHMGKQEKLLRQQLSYDVEDIRGSGAFSADSDTAISLSVYDEDATGMKVPQDRNGIWELQKARLPIHVMAWVTKSRHGEIGQIPFVLDQVGGMRMTPLNDMPW